MKVKKNKVAKKKKSKLMKVSTVVNWISVLGGIIGAVLAFLSVGGLNIDVGLGIGMIFGSLAVGIIWVIIVNIILSVRRNKTSTF